MATIQDVIQDNEWKSTSFEQSTDVNRLFNSGILTNAGDTAQSILMAMDESNVQETVRVGLSDIEFAEQNLGDATENSATSLEATFKDVDIKTFYGNQWWAVRTIQKDLLNETKPNMLVLNRIGEFWATQYNRIISNTISGMSDITEITTGDGSSNLSRIMVIEARQKKGDMGYGMLAKMHMNSTQIAWILTQQASDVIDTIITARYGMITIVVDGVEQQVQSETPTYVYDGVTEIVIDDSIKNGIISMIEDSAFAFSQKDLANPLMYDNSPKLGNGVGKEEWGTKGLYIIHPIGFSFIGTRPATYANKSGLTFAELQNGLQYDLAVDPKLARITNLKVKFSV
jgi:hypothetical protein